jgi:hypothetical protein
MHGPREACLLTSPLPGRPTFAEILAKLDDIFVEMVLQEEVAQKLWQSLKDKVRHTIFTPMPYFVCVH